MAVHSPGQRILPTVLLPIPYQAECLGKKGHTLWINQRQKGMDTSGIPRQR
jgi:hypothetical protein